MFHFYTLGVTFSGGIEMEHPIKDLPIQSQQYKL